MLGQILKLGMLNNLYFYAVYRIGLLASKSYLFNLLYQQILNVAIKRYILIYFSLFYTLINFV